MDMLLLWVMNIRVESHFKPAVIQFSNLFGVTNSLVNLIDILLLVMNIKMESHFKPAVIQSSNFFGVTKFW
jgi:hypothetical protein